MVKGKTKKKLLTSMTIAATLATTTTAATTTASTTTTTMTTTATATADASIMEKIDSLSGQPRDKFLFDPLRIFFAPLSRKKGFFIFLNSDGPFYSLVKCVIGTQISGKERQKANLRDRERVCVRARERVRTRKSLVQMTFSKSWICVSWRFWGHRSQIKVSEIRF